ncbi:hypothetical protein [Algoriphagus boritolerans]|uniref:hypothetical protein n=1 Tax=Algoriphagus boritolerans TaxID=308111 RepID=UPI000ABAA65B
MIKHLLLVEDEPLAQARISEIIRKHRPDWVIADSAQSIVELDKALENQDLFDLILCDIHLADGLSFKAFQRKKNQSSGHFYYRLRRLCLAVL